MAKTTLQQKLELTAQILRDFDACQPRAMVAEVSEHEYTDGKWRTTGDVPWGAQRTGNVAILGYALTDGRATYGMQHESVAACLNWAREHRERERVEFDAALQKMSVARLRSQASYWQGRAESLRRLGKLA